MKADKTLSFTYWKCDKKSNQFLRELEIFDWEEGVCWKERGVLSLKGDKEVGDSWKRDFVENFIKINDELGFEICNLTFEDL